MAEELIISENTDRSQRYKELTPQIAALISGEKNLIANLSNVAACLKSAFNFLWVGFYLIDGDDELVLGPFQGPIACTRIKKGKGVCGTAWETEETLVVPNVMKFNGHITCSPDSRSEIVVPIFSGSDVIGVLDVDSNQLNDFSDVDKEALETICALIFK